MKIIEYSKDILPKETCISIGMFDGVHIGHIDILQKVCRTADRLNSPSAVMTFDRNPADFFNSPKPTQSLISLDRRIELIREQNIDQLILVHFNREFAAITADDFIQHVLMDTMQIKAVVSGPNARFGARGEGDAERLNKKFNGSFEIHVVPFAEYRGQAVSSTRIRREIANGNLAHAAVMLGRPVAVSGTVVKGHAVGRTLGVPTANIMPDHGAIPPTGIYACTVDRDGHSFKAVSCIGHRPTFSSHSDRPEPVVETHILGMDTNLYDEHLRVLFFNKLRDEKKFNSAVELKSAMEEDIRSVAAMELPGKAPHG